MCDLLGSMQRLEAVATAASCFCLITASSSCGLLAAAVANDTNKCQYGKYIISFMQMKLHNFWYCDNSDDKCMSSSCSTSSQQYKQSTVANMFFLPANVAALVAQHSVPQRGAGLAKA